MAHDEIRTINQTHFRIKAHCDIAGDTSLRSLWIEIPDYCQLQCPYCFANTCRNNPHLAKDNLEVEGYLRLLDDFKASGGQFLGIPGNGEPFHPGNRELVLSILRHADRLGLRTTVFTTGETLFWEMRTDRTYAENVGTEPDFTLMDELMGLDVILLIKCNSLIPEVQDRLVSQPGYTEARKKAMQWLMEKYRLNSDQDNRRLGIVTSIMPENQDEIVDLYRHAEENHLIFDCDTLLPRGRGKSFIKPGHCLSDQEYRAIYRTLDSISEEHLATGGSYVGVACDRIKHHLYIDIRGNAYTCIGCVGRGQELVLGNIRHQSLEDIWNNTIRVQMRDNLDEIVLGPCSYCENFQVSCWSCLGRSVERFEIKNDKVFLHTCGCFNHQPDWNRWLLQCDRLTHARVSEVPTSIREQVRNRIHQDGLELFWQEVPEAMIGAPRTRQIPIGRKDICFSDLNFPTRMVWDFTSVQEIENTEEYLKSLGTLLPRILLCSLKQISERGVAERHDKAFVPSPWSNGAVQFTNLMFYLPQKKRYMYRTIVQNSFDPGVLDLDEYRAYAREHSDEWEKVIQELRIRSRMGRLWQRWAEALRDGEDAPILPHIKNLSQKLENKNIETYELILTEELYQQERIWIDTDIVHNDLDILTIFPLLDTSMIKDRVANMHRIVRAIAEDENAWKEVYSIMADHVFVHSWDSKGEEMARIEATYQKLAGAGFYPILANQLLQPVRDELESQLRTALSEILRVNLHLFPDSAESDWFESPLPPSLSGSDWEEFFAMLGGPHRARNRQSGILPGFLRPSEFAKRDVLIARTYNPLLLQMMRLFVDEASQDGSLRADWPRAVNYFIWLSFFREYLGIQTYFVHHAHNLLRLLDVFLGDQDVYSTPSGMIVCTHERLSLRARNDYRKLFTQVMNPLEELVQAEFLSMYLASSESHREEAHRIAEARKMALGHYGHTLKNRLDVLNAFLDIHGTPEIKLHKDMLRDLTLILQLNTLDNREELLERLPGRKIERFLDIEGQKGVEESIDLIARIRNWKDLVSGVRSRRITDPEHGVNADRYCHAELDIDFAVDHAFIGLHLEANTGSGKRKARLKEAIYREVLFELFNNAMRHGTYEATYDPGSPGDYHMSVGMYICAGRHIVEEKIIHLLVICNEVQEGKAETSQIILEARKHTGWSRWPESKKYDGPGMSVELLRRLGLGDMYYQVEEVSDESENRKSLIYRVGLYFEGMELKQDAPIRGQEDAL